MNDRPPLTPGPVWGDRARAAYRQQDACNAAAAAEDEHPIPHGDPWAAEMHRDLARLWREMGEVRARYASLAGTAAGNALLADLEDDWRDGTQPTAEELVDAAAKLADLEKSWPAPGVYGPQQGATKTPAGGEGAAPGKQSTPLTPAVGLMREHAPGHPVGYEAGPGGMHAVFCKVDGCDFHEVTGGRSA